MGSRRKALLELSHYLNSLSCPTKRSSFHNPVISLNAFLASRYFSSSFSRTSETENDRPPRTDREAMLLEKFRNRKLKGSSNISRESLSSNSAVKGSGNGGEKVMTGFKELGLYNEVAEAAEGMGFFVPSELLCVGIPALLEGKNVVLGSLYGPERALTYLLPLIQNLKRDAKSNGVRSKHPRAFVMCSTTELSDEVFQMAKFISNYKQLKTAKDNGFGKLELQNGASDVSIGLLIGTPNEVSELIEDGSMVSDEIKYLVLDELDTMFDLGFGPNIKKILTSVKQSTSRHCNQKCQSVVVTSTLIKMLHKQHSSLVESLKRSDGGEIAAMLLEIEEEEAFHLMESPDTLKCKLADAVESLRASTNRT
ncbi:DEAD-box ATP-dependent RNA helicase 39-like [Cucurbita maxima]|uniref:DEAD-box ATP-dependent RNA helicase 39-like n=1 Tax=Cucurbita maxima TaxID=3661 RepID=A0A6J1JT03_CUCMA|nr:DEAD-box ATP-dependent RNA helicase 39-like [Cucurbita maxima]